MTATPILYRCKDGAMWPFKRFHNEFHEQFEDGRNYRLAPVEERSMRSHSHFFASLHEAWQNLPEIYAQEFPTDEHLRKYALIHCGWADKESYALDSKDDALKFAAFARRKDDYAVVTVYGSVVTIYTAKSQSKRAMGTKDFQASKEAVLDYAWSLCGIASEQGNAEAGASA